MAFKLFVWGFATLFLDKMFFLSGSVPSLQNYEDDLLLFLIKTTGHRLCSYSAACKNHFFAGVKKQKTGSGKKYDSIKRILKYKQKTNIYNLIK